MAAFKLKLPVIEQGATYDRVVTWKAGTPPVPVDLTGCTARMQVRAKFDSPVLLELTTEDGGLQLGGTAGTVRILISAAATTLITWKAAIYDLEIVFSNGTVRRLVQGAVAMSPEVTKALP